VSVVSETCKGGVNNNEVEGIEQRSILAVMKNRMDTACLLNLSGYPIAAGPRTAPRQTQRGIPQGSCSWIAVHLFPLQPVRRTWVLLSVPRYATLSPYPPPSLIPVSQNQCGERNALYVGPVDRTERGHTARTFPPSRRVLPRPTRGDA